MAFIDYIRTALKNLTRQKSRTFLTIIAITVGSLSLILMASLIISIRSALMDQFQQLGAFSLVSVTKDPNSVDNSSLLSANGDPSEGKKIDDTTLATMKKIAHVKEATPTVTGMGFSTMKLEDGAKKTWSNLIAYDPGNDVFDLPIAAGRKLTTGDLDKIVVGNNFAQDVGYGGNPEDLVGKKVVMNSKMGGCGGGPDWGALPAKPPANGDNKDWCESQSKNGIDITAEIVGVSSNGNIDSGGSYMTLAWAKRLMTQVRWEWDEAARKQCDEENSRQQQYNKETGKYTGGNSNSCENLATMKLVKDDQLTRSGYTSIVLKADSQDNIKAIAEEVTKQGYGAVTAENMIKQINQIFTMIGVVLCVIGGISLFVAAIGIINTMIMATYERIREIGVMRACGATRATIRRIFTFEAALLGFWGGLFGLAISIALIKIAKFAVTHYGANLGNIPIDKIGSFPIWLVLTVMAFTTFLGMAAGLYPAIRAARLDPVEALRYE